MSPGTSTLRPGRAQNRVSLVLHQLTRASESPLAAAAAAAVSAAFLLGALLAARATPWLTAFEALAAALTLIMVFVLQHTQARQQAALQLKLDEILRVMPGANTGLMRLESAPAEDLADAVETHAAMDS